MRREATDLEKIFARDTPDKGLLPWIYKEPLKLNDKSPKNGQKTWETPPQRGYQWQVNTGQDVHNPVRLETEN